MIHQFIFAAPKPGMSAGEFQEYWLNIHAPNYAVKIPQIRRYLVGTRVPSAGSREAPLFQGVAELWLQNDEELLASMQTPEFLDGARVDEPRWAAFWCTFVHDADAEILREAPLRAEGYSKLYVFMKRRAGASLAQFRAELLGSHSERALLVPGTLGYLAAFARPGAYGFGEPRFDAIEVYSFNTPAEAATAASAMSASWETLCNPDHIFTFVGQEHWVIPPGQRD